MITLDGNPIGSPLYKTNKLHIGSILLEGLLQGFYLLTNSMVINIICGSS